jgi:hypothetical protein
VSGFFNFPNVNIAGSINFDRSHFKTDANFSGTIIAEKTDCSKARFNQANFTGVEFGREVDFSDAMFEKKAGFQQAKFVNGPVCLDAVFTNGADIKWGQIKKKLGNSINNSHSKAQEEYGELVKIFRGNSDYVSMDRAWEMFRHHENMANEDTSRCFKELNRVFLKGWTGYGTKPLNVFLAALGVIVLFAYIYSFFSQQFEQPLVGWDSYLYFSLTTFIAAGVEGINPVFEGWLKILVVLEAFMGFLLMTLFTVMLARKLTR